MTKTEILAEGITVHLGDCREILPLVGQVDAVVTSPPYDNLRAYGATGSPVIECIAPISRSIKDGGVIVWNVADQVIDGSETGTSFKQALAFMGHGLRLHDTMIYCKEGVTFPDANRYHPAFEYMFILSNGAPIRFNGIKDWKNKWGGSAMHGTDRQTDGTTKQINGMGRPVPNYGLRRNWWVIANAYTGETAGHPAPMPYSLAADHITTWTAEGDIILDPYTGSGTTGVAAAKLGRKFVGIEIEAKYFDIACRRIREALKQTDLFVTKPAPVQISLLDAND